MAKKSPEVLDKVSKLKKEKSALIEKNRSLAEIIEEITKERDDEEEAPKKKDMEDEVSSVVKKEIESELSGLDDKLKDLDKITEMAKKVQELSDQIKAAPAPAAQQGQPPQNADQNAPPAPPANPLAGNPTQGTQIAQNIVATPPATGPVGKALASFGEDVDFQTEIIEIKNTIADVNKNLNNLQKKMEYRVSRLEDETKALDRISELEQGFEEISEKLSPENVQKLKRLIFSTDELVDEILPDLINKRLRTRVDPILSDLGNTKNAMEVLNTRFVSLRNDLRQLQKFENDVNELGMNLKVERDRVNKKIEGYEENSVKSVENLREEIKKKISKVSDDVSKIQIKSTQLIADVVKDMFMDIVDPKISDIEKGNVVLNERLKKMFESIEKVKREVSKIQAPENLKAWLDDKGDEIQKKLQMEVVSVLRDKLSVIERMRKDIEKNYDEIKVIDKELSEIVSLKKSSEKHSQEIGELKERTRKLEIDTKDIPNHLDHHIKQINRLSDTKDIFGNNIEKLFGETKSLSEKTLTNDKNISAINSELKSAEKSTDSRFDGVTNDIVSINDNLHNLETFTNRLSDDTNKTESELKEEISNTRAGLSVFIDKRVETLKKDLEKVRDHDLNNQIKDFRGEIKKISGIEGDIKTFRNSQEDTNKKLIKDISCLENTPSDIISLREKSDSLENVTKNLDRRLGTEIPETMNSLVNVKFQEVTDGITREISGIKNDLFQNNSSITKRIDSQQLQINGIDNSRESLAEHTRSIKVDLKAIKESLSNERNRIATIEKETKSLNKTSDSKFSDLSVGVASLQHNVSDNEKFAQILTKEVAGLESELNTGISKIRSEMSAEFENNVSSLRNDIQDKIMEDAKKDLEHLNSEVSRIDSLEQNLNNIEKSYNSFAEKTGRNVGFLQNVPEDIQNIKKKVNELETIDKDLDKRLNSLKSPENIKKWFDSKVEDFRKDLSRNIREIETQMNHQSDNQSDLKDTVLTLTNISRNIPTKLENQQRQINKILDSRESLSSQTMSLQETMKQFASDMSSDRKRLLEIEKTITAAYEPRLDGISQNIATINQEVSNMQGFANGIAKDLSSTVGELRDDIGTVESKIAMRFDKTITNFRSELASARDKEFKNQMEKFKQEMDRLSSLEKGLESIETVQKQSDVQQCGRLSNLEKMIPEMKYLRDKVESLESENRRLAEVVSKNQVQIVEAIDQKTADKRKLERNLHSQKTKMSELLKELKK